NFFFIFISPTCFAEKNTISLEICPLVNRGIFLHKVVLHILTFGSVFISLAFRLTMLMPV
ncbi:hypothetical protein, partial [Eisenbergiella sp.]|uniref:hypothetical protein n=1 Tax=Eisenbergiella sp. TaxID=1924109 RepID=UPI002A7F9C1D